MCLCLLLCLLCSATRFCGATLGLPAWEFFTHPLPLTSMIHLRPTTRGIRRQEVASHPSFACTPASFFFGHNDARRARA